MQRTYKGFCKEYTRLRADIHLSEKEKKYNLIKEVYGVENYWVVAPGGKRDCTAKMWDWRRFQEVVDHFKGAIQFVTIGKSDHLITRLDGVIDLTDKFNEDIRGLVPLCYHANGGVGGVTFLLHMMGALPNKFGHYSKPFICFVGGREPLTFTTYNQVHSLHASGIYTCCDTGGCWASRVKPLMKDKKLNNNLCAKPVKIDGQYIQECMHNIVAADVIRLFERIYAGDIYRSLKPVTRPIRAVKTYNPPGLRQLKASVRQVPPMPTDNWKEYEVVKEAKPNKYAVASYTNPILSSLVKEAKKMFCKQTGCGEEAENGKDYCDKHAGPADGVSAAGSPRRMGNVGGEVAAEESKKKEVKKKPFVRKLVNVDPPVEGAMVETEPDPFKRVFGIDSKKKEINVLASLSSEGGGEQSVLKIVEVLREAGWTVNLIPWANVSKKLAKRFNPLWVQHDYIGDIDDSPRPDFEALAAGIGKGLPLLFYGNDQIWDFCKYSQPLIEACSSLIVCINWANGDLPRWHWLSKSRKLRAVIFHCEEKRQEFDRDVFGFEDTARVVLFGAIDLEKFLQVQPLPREEKEPLRVVKHCVADARKYVTAETQPGGDKKHVWQNHFWKDTDMDLYTKLLKKFGKKVIFEFMAAPQEVRDYFKDEERMRFYKWNDAPVDEFLARGHVYFYRTSNHWRDNYPRVVAEALAAGLPVLGEPRDGTKDRIQHGDTGFYCCHYDELELHLGTLLRKEGLRQAMGLEAKRWAERNLNPKAWASVIEELLL